MCTSCTRVLNYKTFNNNGMTAKDIGRHTRPILRFSCGKPYEWKNLTFPEQFQITAAPYASSHTYGSCFDSADKFKNAMFDHVNSWEKYRIASFASSNGRPLDKLVILASARCLAQFTRDMTTFEALTKYLPKNKVLDPTFLQAYKDLSEKYTDNPSSYNDFIDTYGTHYWARGYYGNAYHIYVITEKSIGEYRPSKEDGIKALKEKLATNEQMADWLSEVVDEESQKARSSIGQVSLIAFVEPSLPTPNNNVVVVRSSTDIGDPWYSQNINNFLGGWALDLPSLLEDHKQPVKIESLGTTITKYLQNVEKVKGGQGIWY